jgi:hypothetical protein
MPDPGLYQSAAVPIHQERAATPHVRVSHDFPAGGADRDQAEGAAGGWSGILRRI